MTLKIVNLQSHADESSLAYTVTFDDTGSGRRMIAEISEAAFFESTAHPECDAINVEPMARGTLHSEKYDTDDMIRMIKKCIRDEANGEP
jgi:hypothetical protein